MKYLVTGGAGFIGSHLTDRLLDMAREMVVVVDDFSEGKMDNLPHKNPLLDIQKHSILAPDPRWYKGVDTVFHLAAYTRPQESIVNPHLTNQTNVNGTLVVLEAAKAAGVRRVVFVSTSSIYGDQKVSGFLRKHPTKETARPNIMSPYALTKLAGEHYCKLFGEIHGMEINIIRPFNVYGSRQNPDSAYAAAVPAFIYGLKRGKTPFITGDGEQARDYIYVDDLVDLILLAAEPGTPYGEVFNGGSGRNISINRVYEIIAATLGSDTKPDYVDAVFEPRETLADVSKAWKLLGWRPTTNIVEGLIKTVKETK